MILLEFFSFLINLSKFIRFFFKKTELFHKVEKRILELKNKNDENLKSGKKF